MPHLRQLLCFSFVHLVIPLTLVCCGRSCPVQAADNWQTLFDGRSLSGWDCDESLWRVEDGSIVGEIPAGELLRKNTWLVWAGGQLTDFDLRLKVRLSGHPAANSGIQIRCQVDNVDHVSGYQADLDQGQTWLGRIYDEHGRGLIVERGTRVEISEDGTRRSQTLAPASHYGVLFRENDWNDYRIVGIGNRITVFVNGTLFSDLIDRQTGQSDLSGQLAFQLHAGPETLVAFRDIQLAELNGDDGRLGPFTISESSPAPEKTDAAPGMEVRSTRNPLLQHLVPNPVPAGANFTGSETLAQMYVPEGFSVDVIAAEPRLHQPMAFTFDTAGRLWVVEGHCYPQKRPAGEGLDRILIFADTDGDGEFETRKVFMEGLNLVSGLEVGYGGVWVGAAPELLFIPDRDADDQPDSDPEILLDGFGYADTHETLNSFIWGPDGWLYGNQGVFNSSAIGKPGTPDNERFALSAGVWRYHPLRHTFEVFAHGGSNQWGLDYDEFGNWFMTHCRSFFGRGAVTHVMQGAHYWNQVNRGFAPFISAVAPDHLPAMKNYMLASARYGHGEGGAGKKGSRAVYGGHAHVGTMIYQGGNWPDEYRNHLFTHNLHGHQMNHLVNHRDGGGFNTRHAGHDMFLCADPQFIGVELKSGPDGAVYFSDWYDPRHCHNPNAELWDRGNGRLYRMKYDATFTPYHQDIPEPPTDGELAEAALHPHDWQSRTGRRLLSERRQERPIAETDVEWLREVALREPEPARRLRAVWALNAVEALDAALLAQLINDDNEFVRGWVVQLATESLDEDALTSLLTPHVRTESSLLTRRYLASAIQRVPQSLAWTIAEALASQSENATDRDLPLLLWYGIARLSENDPERATRIADTTAIPSLRDNIQWYAARNSADYRSQLTSRLTNADAAERLRLVGLLELAVRGMRDQSQPTGWSEIAEELYDADDERIRRDAQTLGAVFGHAPLFERLRKLLRDESTETDIRRHALLLLSGDQSSENLDVFLNALDHPELVDQVLPLLSRFEDASVADRIVTRLPDWSGKEQSAAVEILASRTPWASRLLDALAAGDVPSRTLSAYHVRQIAALNDDQLNARLTKDWGMVRQTSEERRAEIKAMVKTFTEAPLWAFDRNKGGEHFKRLCATCHLPNEQNERLGPNLAGTGTKGIEYIVENILDPNAVIGRDYQARVIATVNGQVITGLIESETESAVTIRTATSSVTVNRDDIEETTISENSFMPEGLLKDLSERERIELFIHLYRMR